MLSSQAIIIDIMEEFDCIFCAQIVTSRQEALLCGECDRWQHRRCHTGVDRATYRQAARNGQDISWTCLCCKDETPVNHQAQGLPFPSLLTGVLRRRTQIYKFLLPFSSEQRDREAWGEFTNPRENDPNSMADGRKENTNRTYLLSIFFRSILVQGKGRANV